MQYQRVMVKLKYLLIQKIHLLAQSFQIIHLILINSKTIKTIGLNDLVKEQTSLVKMDVEGAEFDIFEGVSIETLKKIDFLLMEFHDNFGGILRDNILSKLENSGFTYEIFQDNCIDTASEWEERGTIFAKNNNK